MLNLMPASQNFDASVKKSNTALPLGKTRQRDKVQASLDSTAETAAGWETPQFERNLPCGPHQSVTVGTFHGTEEQQSQTDGVTRGQHLTFGRFRF